MPTYVYPENQEIQRIAPDLILSSIDDDPVFTYIFPLKSRRASKLRWSQRENDKGLMHLRGLEGEPVRVASTPGEDIYEQEPGYFGEFATISESELTKRAAALPRGAEGFPVDVSDLVAIRQNTLTTRQSNRMRQVCWSLVLTGAYSVALPGGGVGFSGTVTLQTFTPSVLWNVPATSTPLSDLRKMQTNFGIGTSNRFDGQAVALMNSRTAEKMLANSNAADLGGKRVEGGNTLNDLPSINRILLAQGAPQIVTYDDGYRDEAGTFQLCIPDGKVVVVGRRPGGEAPGEFTWTLNAVNANFEPGPYAFVDDRTGNNPAGVPYVAPRIDVHQGFNGGPAPERPTQWVVINAY